MDEFLPGFIVGVLFVFFIAFLASIGEPTRDQLANRAMACVSSGISIPLCQGMLGIDSN